MQDNFKEWLEYTYGDECWIEAVNDEEIYQEYYREFQEVVGG